MIYIPEKMKEIIGEETFHTDEVGMSADTVLLFRDKVLKSGAVGEESDRERRIYEWLQGKLPVPRIYCYYVEDEKYYLLMSRAAGKMICDEGYMNQPEKVIRILAEGLKTLWQVDIKDCPCRSDLDEKLRMARFNVEHDLVDVENVEPETFGENGFRDPYALLEWLEANRPREELVFSHGDYCLPNVFGEGEHVSAFIDLGRAGVADKWQDIALCYRSLLHNANGSYGRSYAGYESAEEMLFRELDLEPDWEKIRYYILLDELF